MAEGSTNSGEPIRLGGSVLSHPRHICAFFNSPDEEYRVLLPFIVDGLSSGEKAFHTIDPQRQEKHLDQLAKAGIDVATARETGQLQLCTWNDVHLRDGRFDQERTLAQYEDVVKEAKQQGFPLIRFVTHMEWALENLPGVDDLLEYEANANYIWLHQAGPVNPVICTYNLTKFSGDVVVEIMRTHPLIIIGGILQENSFFVPPEEFVRELRERRGSGSAFEG